MPIQLRNSSKSPNPSPHGLGIGNKTSVLRRGGVLLVLSMTIVNLYNVYNYASATQTINQVSLHSIPASLLCM